MSALIIWGWQLRPYAYLAGYEHARDHDEPLCRVCLQLKGYDPLDCIRWHEGYSDARKAQGWVDPHDWRAPDCPCGDGGK